MLNLHWNKRLTAFFTFIILLLAESAQAQFSSTDNLPNYDDKQMHYGFTIGLNATRFKYTLSDYYLASDSFQSITAKRVPGFSLGFVVSYRLNDFFDLRLLPTVAFYERDLIFKGMKSGLETPEVTESTFIELPLVVKYKSQRRRNLRMYMVGGIKPGIEVGAKKKDKRASELRTQNFDFSIDYGFGFDIYYPLFKFSPEIRFSHGILNMLNNDPNAYSQSLNMLLTHTVSLYFHFE